MSDLPTKATPPKRPIQAVLRSADTIERFANYVNKEEAGRIVASVMGVVNDNVVLQQCSSESVVSAALTAVSMGLNVNKSLGQCYIVPYQNKKKVTDENGREREIKVWEAQFQIGYKGFIQLAIRTGLYKTINVTDVREGEYKGENKLTGEHSFEWNEDDAAREKLPIIGYVAYLKLQTGYEKTLYMTREKVMAHAKKYSQSFRSGYGLWKSDFDDMALKTVLKRLISKHGVTTSTLEKALLADQAVSDEDAFNYIDNEKNNQTNKANNDEALAKRIVTEGEIVDGPANATK